MSKKSTIEWQPFSEKHKRYIKTALHSKMSVAEGAIRSGKTIDHCIIAAALLERVRDKIHLASGSTIANAKMNIGDCNGFGLEHLFRGRCRWGKYKDNEALYISTQTGDKVVVFAGGGKADSYKKILGNSYGIWIATEINEHYDSDDSRTSFIKVAMGRQAASLDPYILWDLNPCYPSHPIYTRYIDVFPSRYVGGYNYQHFTIADNLSITEQRRKEIESTYDVGSVWYRRDILGERCIAEGLVYPMFEDAVGEPPDDIQESGIVLSIDYGTQNAFAAILWKKYGNVWYGISEYYYSGRDEHEQKTDGEYAEDLDKWLDKQNVFGAVRTIVDPSAASFITLIKKHTHEVKNGDKSILRRYKVLKADNDVEDGLRETATALKNGLVKVSAQCTAWKKEIEGYIWDEKSAEDRPVKVNDHAMDAMRYFVKTMKVTKVKREYQSIFPSVL